MNSAASPPHSQWPLLRAFCLWLMCFVAFPFTLRSEIPVAATNASGIWMENHNFGEVPLAADVLREFLWRNDTAATQVVRAVQTSCECAQVVASPKTIPPGGFERLAVKAKAAAAGPVQWLFLGEVEGSATPRVFSLTGSVAKATAPPLPKGLLVSAQNLLRDTGRDARRVYVDVRSQDRYGLGRIPGSLNLPQYTVKTASFLKHRQVVLLNDGHDAAGLVEESRRLKALGFESVQVLQGGVLAWQQQGGPMEGDNPQHPALASLSAAQFHAASGQPGWLVLAVGATPDQAGLFWTAKAIPAGLDAAGVNQAVAEALARQQPVDRVLVVTQEGNDYDALANALRQTSLRPVFFLAGGLGDYAQFVRQQLAMRNRRQVTLATSQPASYSHGAAPTRGSGGCCGGKR